VSICKHGGGPNGTTYASSVAIDGNSNVYTVGSLASSKYNFQNNLRANIAGKKIGGVGVGLQNTGFIVKFNPSTKATVFLKQIRLTGDQPSATTDSIVFGSNRLYIAGTLNGNANVFGCKINSGGIYIAQLDLNAKCEKSTVIHAAAFVPYLLADSVTSHLYVYGSTVYGNATFGGHTFPFSDVRSAVFVAQLSWLESYEWILRIASKSPEGDYQTISAIGDIGQDNTHIYAMVQANNSLEFCDIDMQCTTKTLEQNANVVIKISKEDGSHSAIVIEHDAPPYLESFNIAARSTLAGTTEIYIGGLGTEATVTKYNSTFDQQWVAKIPNECCSGFRKVESYTTALRFDHSGNIYASGTTLTGSGARFSVSQPFVAKVKHTNGKVLFNTRASRNVTKPPDPYSGSASLAVDTKEGEAYLVGDYGCTLKWGNTTLSTPPTNCGGIHSSSGRNTYMFIVSVNAASGAGC